MRIVLVGRPSDRTRVRSELEDASLEVTGEFDTLADAHAVTIDADAILLVPRGDAEGARTTEREDAEWIDEPLTRRELDVLELLAQGLPNKAIAVQLGVSGQTIKFHVASILGKLGATNRTKAVRLAFRRGMISL